MKKSFAIVLVLLLLPLISAVQINLNQNYNQGETLIAQVSGNFLDQIQQQNVLLYNGHVRVSFIPTVQKLGDSFYVYGSLQGKSPGNYSLVISGVRYAESGVTKTSDVAENFTITNSSADFSVSPGLVESQGAFAIIAQNLRDNSIEVESFLANSSSSSSGGSFSIFHSSDSSIQLTTPTTVRINPGKNSQISFSVTASENDQLIFAVLQTNSTYYEIPVFIPSNSTPLVFQPPLSFQPNEKVVSMPADSNLSYHISLINAGSYSQQVNLSVSDNLKDFVSVPDSVIIASNSTNSILININSGPTDKLVKGQIIASSPNSTTYFDLTLNFTKDYVAPPQNASLFETCGQLGGIFCNDTSNCDVDTQNAEDGICCVGNCIPVKQDNTGAVIGWILAAVIIGFVAFFFIRRYRKTQRKPLNLLDFARKKI